MAHVPTADAQTISSIVAFVRARDEGAAAALLSCLPLSQHGQRVPAAVVPQALETAAALLREPCVGLQIAAAADARRHGIVHYVAANSETLHDAWRRIARYVRLWNEGIEIRVDVAPGRSVLELHPRIVPGSTEGLRQWFGLAARALVLASARFTAGAALPARVEFGFAPPEHTRPWRAAFGPHVSFGAPTTRLVYRAHAAQARVHRADPALASILSRQADEMLARCEPPRTWAMRVHELMLQPAVRNDLAAVARELGVTARMLQRRLHAEGASFGGVREQARRGIALARLRDRSAAISEIAWVLGYTELSAFYRAFRRWTGTTPALYRERQP